MANVLSLFSDAEMMGVVPGAADSSASVCVTDMVAGPNGSVPRTETQVQSFRVLSELAPPQVVEVVARFGSEWGNLLDPCVKCRYRGLCDSEECAMKCYPLDMNHAPKDRGWKRFGI